MLNFKAGDVFLGVFVVGILFLIIIPLPSAVLSTFLILNISIATMILLSALFSSETLDLSLFPTILLITTVFRLALNISSTRLILRDADAGPVVFAFGEFVSGGDLIIGIIIFLIISIVNFLVITKGSERVAEVSARFALDAMPGKQMAIDADLNSGFIDEKTAKERRKKVQDEASFFGSMDGASKFVKNDAVASLLISGINIIAGLSIGVLNRQMDFTQALSTFTILTIGDGLVSALPALLISVATGILVTKTTSEGSMSGSLGNQLVFNPMVLHMVAVVLLVLGVFTPMGVVVTLPMATLWFMLGLRRSKQDKVKEMKNKLSEQEEEAEDTRRPENVMDLLQVDPIELEFGYGIIPLADVNQGGDLFERVVMIRKQIALDLGTIVPVIRVRDNIQLAPNTYSIKIKGNEVASGEILFEHYMVMDPGYVEEEIEGIETIEPAFGLPAQWITEDQRERAEVLGYTVVDCPSVIATHLTEVIKSNLHQLLCRQDVQTLLDNMGSSHGALVSELTPKLLGLGEIQKVLANLLKEKVSIRDLVTICETLADHATTIRDVDILTEYVRQSLIRTISKRTFKEKQVNKVLSLSQELEEKIMSNIQHSEQGAFVALEPSEIQNMINNIATQVEQFTSFGLQPILLASPIVRIYVKRLIEQYIPNLIVISYNEIEPHVEIQSIGTVG